MSHIIGVHYLLEVLDEIVVHNRHPPISDFFIALMFQREQTFKYFKHYTGQVMLSADVEKYVKSTKEGNDLLRQMRLRLVKHYKV